MLQQYIVLLALAIIAVGCGTTTRPVQRDDWYQGGTLHQKSAAEWNAASARDRLATSADFVAKVSRPSSMDDLKAKANPQALQTSPWIAPAPGLHPARAPRRGSPDKLSSGRLAIGLAKSWGTLTQLAASPSRTKRKIRRPPRGCQ